LEILGDTWRLTGGNADDDGGVLGSGGGGKAADPRTEFGRKEESDVAGLKRTFGGENYEEVWRKSNGIKGRFGTFGWSGSSGSSGVVRLVWCGMGPTVDTSQGPRALGKHESSRKERKRGASTPVVGCDGDAWWNPWTARERNPRAGPGQHTQRLNRQAPSQLQLQLQLRMLGAGCYGRCWI
jgi:hypothetical protein